MAFFWNQERAISRAIHVRLPWFLHGSIALSVLFKIGVWGFITSFDPKTPPKMTGFTPKKAQKTAKQDQKCAQIGLKMGSKRCQNDP